MEILFEILVELYMELMLLVVPEEKVTTKKYKVIVTIIAIIGVCATLVSFIFGMSLILDHNNLLGIIPLVFAVLISFLQIIMGIRSFKNR